MDRKIALNEDEAALVLEALRRLRETKNEAHAVAVTSGLSFTARDFAIPQLDALADRFSTVFEAEDAPEREA